MAITGLTPAVRWCDRPVKLEIRSDHALGWNGSGLWDDDRKHAFLAESDRVLLWCFLKACGDEDYESDLKPSDSKSADKQVGLKALVDSLDSLHSCSTSIGLNGLDSEHNHNESNQPIVIRLDQASETQNDLNKPLVEGFAGGWRVDELEQRFRDFRKSILGRLSSELDQQTQTVLDDYSDVQISPSTWAALTDSNKLLKSGDISFDPVHVGSAMSNPLVVRQLEQAKMASMKQLAYGASHEINNPLANIASRAQMLLADETDPGRRLKLAKINEQAFRANEMIADMMLFAHPPSPEFTTVDPLPVIQQVMDELRPIADRQNTQLELQAASCKSGVLDGQQLAVAVKALVQNSLEALGEGGSVRIDIANPANDWLLVEVTDNGPGIPDHIMPHLFDPFFSGREAGRGLGFGLSKAWRIAELHGGEISATRPAHGGVRFQLRIPYRDRA